MQGSSGTARTRPLLTTNQPHVTLPMLPPCRENKSRVPKRQVHSTSMASSRSLTLDFILNLKNSPTISIYNKSCTQYSNLLQECAFEKKGRETLGSSNLKAQLKTEKQIYVIKKKKKTCFFLKKKNGFCWNRLRVGQEHLRVLTHFYKPFAKSQRKSPIISAKEVFFKDFF